MAVNEETKKEPTEVEKKYIGKIKKIWEKKDWSISKKFAESQKVVDSVDKIWARTDIPDRLVEYAANTLKISLYDAVSEAMYANYGNGKELDNGKILAGIAKGIKNKWW